MSKCIGCGSNFEGSNKYCERCFRIKNYSDYKSVTKTNEEYINILKNINKTNDLIVYVIDIFNIPKNINEIFNYVNNDVLLVITKRDCLPKSMIDEKILNYFDFDNKIIISSLKNYNMDSLMDKINKLKRSNNVYVIGYTNSGKSTLINKIIYDYTTLDVCLTTSIMPSTTLDSIEVKINNDLTIIDTPGLLYNGNIMEMVDASILKKILPKREIKPITYQLKTVETINIDNICYISSNNTNMTLYFSNDLKIDRLYKEYLPYDVKEISVKKNEDLVIYGLGFITFTKDSIVNVSSSYECDIYTRKSIIKE